MGTWDTKNENEITDEQLLKLSAIYHILSENNVAHEPKPYLDKIRDVFNEVSYSFGNNSHDMNVQLLSKRKTIILFLGQMYMYI